MMGDYGHMWGWGGNLFPFSIPFLLQIIVFILIIAFIVSLVRKSSSKSKPHESNAKSSLAVLEERFARGEIDEDEFKQKRAVLLENESNYKK